MPHVIQPDDDPTNKPAAQSSTPTQKSLQLITLRQSGNISIQALHHVMQLEAFKVASNAQWTRPNNGIKEHCFGVVHFVTKETIKQYK